jgi:uncharacterized SAM-binding protein YcdF (DUF218 family)
MVSFFIKLFLALLAPVLIALGFLVLTPQILSIDDLNGCSGPEQVNSHCMAADVIVAISGGDTDARAHEAIALYKQGWAPVIIFSGAAQDKSGSSNAAAMRQQAIDSGVPVGAVLLDEASVNTADNASQVRPIVVQHGFKRLILVTSPYHQRRASIEFNRRMGDIATIINHPTSSDRYWDASAWWSTPLGLWLGVSELFKVIVVSVYHGQ